MQALMNMMINALKNSLASNPRGASERQVGVRGRSCSALTLRNSLAGRARPGRFVEERLRIEGNLPAVVTTAF
jgi:hypothetical protein